MGVRDYARIFRPLWLLIQVATMLRVLVAWGVTAATQATDSATTVSSIDPDRGDTLGLVDDRHENLADWHSAQTARSTNAPDPTVGTTDALGGGLQGGNAARADDQRGRGGALTFPSMTGG